MEIREFFTINFLCEMNELLNIKFPKIGYKYMCTYSQILVTRKLMNFYTVFQFPLFSSFFTWHDVITVSHLIYII